ncbi:hypothetical protein SNEBB_005991 [Seison nebaliae]|nr:hypothetical protein SNEBB_005991 [Seison nebaliae]
MIFWSILFIETVLAQYNGTDDQEEIELNNDEIMSRTNYNDSVVVNWKDSIIDHFNDKSLALLGSQKNLDSTIFKLIQSGILEYRKDEPITTKELLTNSLGDTYANIFKTRDSVLDVIIKNETILSIKQKKKVTYQYSFQTKTANVIDVLRRNDTNDFAFPSNELRSELATQLKEHAHLISNNLSTPIIELQKNRRKGGLHVAYILLILFSIILLTAALIFYLHYKKKIGFPIRTQPKGKIMLALDVKPPEEISILSSTPMYYATGSSFYYLTDDKNPET